MPRSPRAALLSGGLVACLVAGCGLHSAPAPAATDVVDVSVSDCGSAWHPRTAGEQDLALHNADSRPGEVQVIGLGDHRGLVYADVEPFGPGTTVDVHVPLAAGRYALACLMEDAAPVSGPTRTLAGGASGAPGVPIVTEAGLVASTQRYETWLRHQLRPLVRDTRRLRDLVADREWDAARRAWTTAHLDYQRLGAAYDAFGDLGDRIDGLPQGLPGGTADPDWTGFHRVEDDLWRARPGATVRPDTTALARQVARLPAAVASAELDPTTLTLRAHEIAENALQFQLTGQDDFGSHTDLAAVRAELVGTAVVLRALAGPIRDRVSHPKEVGAALRATLRMFTHGVHQYSGVAVDRLPRDERERLDASLSELTERLASIPATLEPRLTVASGTLHGGAG